MSIRLHLSAHGDALLAALRPALAAARRTAEARGAGIPRPVSVLIPSAQLADWLQVRLARDLGLSMGFEFLPPGEYFGRRFAGDAETHALAASHVFWSPEQLRWQLLPIVETVAIRLGHDSAKPLASRDRFAFAGLLAQQFERYARHRPDWPARWAASQSGWPRGTPDLTDAARDDELWQRELWRRLAALPDAPPHPARILAELGGAVASPADDSALGSDSGSARAVATPLFVVGADLLDPLLLRTLQVLAGHGHDVSLHLLLPSLGYLGDQTRRAALNVRLATTPPEDALELGGHPLLASLGQQAVGNFLLLETLSPDYAEWPEVADELVEPPADASLLRRLQADIRAQRTPPGPPPADGSAFDDFREAGAGVEVGDTLDLFAPAVAVQDARPRLAPDDHSLRIHSCHGPRRELEVLRDELLRAFAEIPGLQPEDVLVAVTDFDTYAPLAEGILRGGAQPLPVRLTAVPEREANPVAAALLALLRLAPGRHTASELVELLNLAAVQHHLDLFGEAATLARLGETIRISGLTHDLDSSARGNGDATGTWRAALDRHLAGTWLGVADAARDADGAFVHPLAPDLHHDDDVRLDFVRWLTRLAGQLREWNTEASATAWATRLEIAVDTLLHAPALDDHAAAVRRLLGELARVAADTPLDAAALLDWLRPKLENATSLRTSMGGEILFGRLDQLHGLPCRVFALLGLQDGAFPRSSRRPAWDLLAHRPERWDSDPRTQDRQWFLDCLLTPADRLILGASNRSLRTAHDGPLASCVEELLRAAAATVRPPEGGGSLEQRLVVRHRIQPFATDYFAGDGPLPRSFDAAAADIARNLAAVAADSPAPFFNVAAHGAFSATDEPLALTFGQLATFWKDPARAWLRALQLDLAGDAADDTALDDAPLGLDSLQAYGIRDTALDVRLASAADPVEVSSRLVADRALPPGALGALAWEIRDREITPLAEGLAPLLARCTPASLALDLGHGVRLTGEIQLGDADTGAPWVLVHRPGNYEKKPRYQFEGFLHALAAAVHLGRPVGGRVCGLDLPRAKVLPALSPEEAWVHLEAFVAGYRQGRHAPLCYGPATSAALLPALTKSEEHAASNALVAAQVAWGKEPDAFGSGGEGATPHARLVWRDADPFAPPLDAEWLSWARAVAAPLDAWWNARPAVKS